MGLAAGSEMEYGKLAVVFFSIFNLQISDDAAEAVRTAIVKMGALFDRGKGVDGLIESGICLLYTSDAADE